VDFSEKHFEDGGFLLGGIGILIAEATNKVDTRFEFQLLIVVFSGSIFELRIIDNKL